MEALLFGGAFNPPTTAHIDLAYHVCRKLSCSHVIFVPTKARYIQRTQKKEEAFSDDCRLSMLRKIAVHHAWMIVSDYEIKASKQPRTYKTLRALSARYHCHSLRLLIGTDKLAQLNPACGIWEHVAEIADEFGYVVMERNRDHAKRMIRQDSFLKQYADCFTIVPVPLAYRDVSSSQIRMLMREIKERQRTLDMLVPGELDGMRAYLYEREKRK